MRKIILFSLIFCLLVTSVFAETTEMEANYEINNAEEFIAEMTEAGFSTVYVNDLLQEAKDAMEYKRYDITLEKTSEIKNRRDEAFDIYDSIISIEIRMEEASKKGVDISGVKETYESAKTEFENENYERANERIDEALTQFSEAEAYTSLLNAQVKRLRSNIFYYIIDNILEIITGLFILGLIGSYAYKRYYKYYLKQKINQLKKEKKAIKKLMIKTQEHRYKHGGMSEETYRLRMDKYGERDVEIDENIKSLKSKLRKRR